LLVMIELVGYLDSLTNLSLLEDLDIATPIHKVVCANNFWKVEHRGFGINVT
jgi:hypothetical protein